MNICIYGSSRNEIPEQFQAGAHRLGQLIAQRGFGLVFGGGKNGLMGLVARGTLSEGGHVTGIAPTFFRSRGVLLEEATQIIYTNTMHERKALMEQSSDAFIATPGGIGTFEELCEIITWRQLGLHSKPIVLYSPGGYYDTFIALLRQAVDNRAMPESTMDYFRVFDTPEDVMEYLDGELRK